MPPFKTFVDAESHAATPAHELTDWTKHEKRLARAMGRIRWGDEGYAGEELVAELGWAFFCADLEITPEAREDHATYYRPLAESAAGRQAPDLQRATHAQRAADYNKFSKGSPFMREGRLGPSEEFSFPLSHEGRPTGLTGQQASPKLVSAPNRVPRFKLNPP